jgi:hypothetical protein
VDGDHQIIVAVGVSNQAADQHHLLAMVERIVANTGQLPEKLIADAGYCSTSDIEASQQCGLDAYLSTSRQEHGSRPRPSRGPAQEIWMHGAWIGSCSGGWRRSRVYGP